jgi:addiction module HigA family antidote
MPNAAYRPTKAELAAIRKGEAAIARGECVSLKAFLHLGTMKNPPHPGHSIKDACLDPLGLSVTEGAKVLGVARHTLSRVVNGQAGISPEMAIRLEKAGWSNADHWLRVQAAYDLAQTRQREDEIKVRRYEPQVAL